MTKLSFDEQIERLNNLSRTHAILPEEYIPWENKLMDNEIYMPRHLFCLSGSSLLKDLNDQQVLRLTQLELGQVLATYAWSEAIGCLMFNEFLMRATPTTAEGKYIVNMMIEEYRHQFMFAKLIDILGVTPLRFSPVHRFMSFVFVKTFRPSSKYVVVLAIEQVTDMYGKHFKRDPDVYSVFKKAVELHHIEEGRHMAFQRICLEKHITKANYLRRSTLGFYFLLTIWFMRSSYVRKEFFTDIGVDKPRKYYREALRNYKKLYGEYCLKDAVEYAKEAGLMNVITRPLWRIILKAKV